MPEPNMKTPATETNLGAPSMARRLRHGWVPQIFRPQSPRSQTLFRHFFRRFFDNDTLPIPGDPETSVYRALSFCAVPALMFAFWLLPQYPNRRVPDAIADRYFFVLFSFVIMGTLATCEWDVLFPDRADFLILLPMPLKSRELFYAKGRALLSLLGLFLIATNLFSLILFPAMCTRIYSNPMLAFGGHFSAVMLAGLFSALTMLAIEGIVLCLLPSRWFRPISAAIQSLAITILLLLFLLYPLISRNLETLLSGSVSFAKFVPPLWFIALYEQLSDGDFTAPGIAALASTGLYATLIAAALCLITYPLAWARQKKRALEGASAAGKPSGNVIAALLHRTLLPRPQQRAIFHFLTQTIARSPRYQVFFALYAGAGLALALCTILNLHRTPDHTLVLTLSQVGLHAVLPLLLFWLLAGLRSSFAFPVDLLSRWVFPINLRLSKSDPIANPWQFPGPDAKAAKTWVLLCAAVLNGIVLAILFALGWNTRQLLVQAICAGALSILLADLFFLGRTQIPFTRLRISGLALAFILYAVFFPTLTTLTVEFELTAESRLKLLTWIIISIPILHLLLKKTDQMAQQGIIGGFPEDETDPGPQTLNLFQ
jgi:hypothetical protein